MYKDRLRKVGVIKEKSQTIRILFRRSVKKNHNFWKETTAKTPVLQRQATNEEEVSAKLRVELEDKEKQLRDAEVKK